MLLIRLYFSNYWVWNLHLLNTSIFARNVLIWNMLFEELLAFYICKLKINLFNIALKTPLNAYLKLKRSMIILINYYFVVLDLLTFSNNFFHFHHRFCRLNNHVFFHVIKYVFSKYYFSFILISLLKSSDSICELK